MLRLARASAAAVAVRGVLRARPATALPVAAVAAARWSARTAAILPHHRAQPLQQVAHRCFASTAAANPSGTESAAAASKATTPQQQGGSTPPPPPPQPPRSWLRIGLLTGAGLVVVSAAGLLLISQQLEPTNPLRTHAGNLSTFSNALLRFWRDLYCTTRIVADYELSLRNANPDSEDYKRLLNEVHLRSAHRLRDLMRTNGGIYIKFGQHIAQMQFLLPDEYVFSMQPMLNQAPTSSLAEVERVIREDLKVASLDDVFESFDPVPVASASLAQVHFATLKRTSPDQPAQRVAVKVQHSALQKNCDSDIATVRFLIDLVHRFDKRFDYKVRFWCATHAQERTRMSGSIDVVCARSRTDLPAVYVVWFSAVSLL
jgi:hypothetical protein